MNCQRCNAIHDGTYGSGKYCCKGCAVSHDPETAKLVGAKNSIALKGRPSKNKGKKLPQQSEAAKKIIYANTQKRWREGPWEQVPASRRRDRLLLEQDGKCALCGIGQEWNGRFLPFEIDHVSGEKKDNSRQNLRAICPNCHRQTDTWGSKNASEDGRKRMAESKRKK